jgi:hypothetical protein
VTREPEKPGLETSFADATQLTVTVPAAQLPSLRKRFSTASCIRARCFTRSVPRATNCADAARCARPLLV